ncbi:MAG: metal ABC transporter ATP-binding protein [Clostridia bacterium]|nr:metal ABC transporter ATP-binding protein [Clostridia bacterium]
MSTHHKDSCGLHCLQVSSLTVELSGKRIVSDVHLHAHCGELTAIIGRNGAGKSTLMKAMIGELKYKGCITFSGHGGTPTPHRPRCGYVPQSIELDRSSPLTVQDLLLCYTSRWPVFFPRRKKTIAALKAHLQTFGADGLLKMRVGALSGGELQRVLLALAMWDHPDVVLLDEPVSGVDNEGLQVFYELIDRLRVQDMLVVLISHDLPFVREKADRVILLEGGCVAASGTPKSVFATEAFERAFPVEARREAE